MELQEVLNYILYILLTVILPVVAKYLVNLIQTKIKESNIISEATKNEDLTKIIENALTDVMDAVLYVNQTYVDALKAKNEFSEEAHKEAFTMAYAKASALISQGTKDAITQMYGSFEKWLELKIESSVNVAKK